MRRPSGIDQRRRCCSTDGDTGDRVEYDHGQRLWRPLRGQRMFVADTDNEQDDAVQPDQLVFLAVAAIRGQTPPASARRKSAPRPVQHAALQPEQRLRDSRVRIQQRLSARTYAAAAAAADVRTDHHQRATAAAAPSRPSRLVPDLGHIVAPPIVRYRRWTAVMESNFCFVLGRATGIRSSRPTI